MPLESNPNVGTTGGGLCDPGGGATSSDTSNGGTASGSGCVVRNIQADGVELPCEDTLNFIGATVEDDPANDRINITITGGGGGSASIAGDDFTALLDGVTTAFTLTETPEPIEGLILMYNGLGQVYNTHFTVSGTTLTTLFTPLAGDNLVAVYPF